MLEVIRIATPAHTLHILKSGSRRIAYRKTGSEFQPLAHFSGYLIKGVVLFQQTLSKTQKWSLQSHDLESRANNIISLVPGRYKQRVKQV